MAAVGADFPGAACPPGSRVSFVRDGRSVNGVVAQLQRRGALVVPEAGTSRLRVGYHRLRVVERAGREHTLGEVEALAAELLELHKSHSGLDRAWVFAFDLAPSRAGACRYPERRITLSVSYCLRASMAQIADTVLHEIAHALVGKAHNHDAVWRAKAREIGCSGERTHDLLHTRARWLGECGCGVRWHRQRLHRRLRRVAVCPACRGEIAWRENTRVLEVDAVIVHSNAEMSLNEAGSRIVPGRLWDRVLKRERCREPRSLSTSRPARWMWCSRSSPTSTPRDSACHRNGRSEAEDPRSGLTRRIPRRSRRHPARLRPRSPRRVRGRSCGTAPRGRGSLRAGRRGR